MKRFACGNVVPGCQARFVGVNDESILGQVAHHQRLAHGVAEMPAALVRRVVEHIEPVAV